MSHRTSTDGPYFSSGSISWSQLRSTFRSGASGSNIKASDFIRYTNTGLTNPDVPDCTENGAVASSQSNWRASQFRNTIRFYYVTQYDVQISTSPSDADINTLTRDGPGTTTDGSNGGRRWNGNLPKNIKKYYNLTGTCGSNSSAWPAIRALGTVYNLEMEITGSILGSGGTAGTGATRYPLVSATTGGNGGNALEFSTNGSAIAVRIRSGSRIYGGGGGGGGGGLGPDGTSGTCSSTTTTSGCGGAGGCPAPYQDAGTSSSGLNCAYVSYCCGFFCCGCTRPTRATITRYCVYYAASTQGLGGVGGNGGPGRGFNNQSGSLNGSGGGAGTCPTCSFGTLSGGTCGQTGRTGGNGGEWGTAGSPGLRQNGSNLVDAGSSGKAISGSSYYITSDSSLSGIRG